MKHNIIFIESRHLTAEAFWLYYFRESVISNGINTQKMSGTFKITNSILYFSEALNINNET